METFSALLAFCAGNSLVPDEFPAQKPVTRNFGVFFDLRNSSINNRDAADLRRHRSHYDVIVMTGEQSMLIVMLMIFRTLMLFWLMCYKWFLIV